MFRIALFLSIFLSLNQLCFPQVGNNNVPSKHPKIKIVMNNGSEFTGQLQDLFEERLVIIKINQEERTIPIDSVSAVKHIRNVRRSTFLKRTAKGFLVGSLMGGGIGYFLVGDESSGDVIGFSKKKNALIYGILTGALGAGIGALRVADDHSDIVYKLSDSDESEKIKVFQQLLSIRLITGTQQSLHLTPKRRP